VTEESLFTDKNYRLINALQLYNIRLVKAVLLIPNNVQKEISVKISSSKYPSAVLDPWVLHQLIDNYDPKDDYGYFLVDDRLVPYSFFDRLFNHLMDNNFEYGEVISINEICGLEFLESLTADEYHVLGPCILMILESGFALVFSQEEKYPDPELNPNYQSRCSHPDCCY
jgi:hypothetical protein